MFDSNIFDKIIEEDRLIEKLKLLTKNGKIEILTTHIQEDEIKKTPDKEKREKLVKLFSSIPIKGLPTSGFVIGISKIGRTLLGGALLSRNVGPKRVKDSIIGATTSSDADVLVTEDKPFKNLVKRKAPNIEVWDFKDFLSYINTS